MDTGQAAVVLLYALFWSGALGRLGRYEAFKTSLFWSEDDQQRKAFRRRFVAGVFLLNLFPGAWLLLLYFVIVAPGSGVGAVASGLIAAFSFFAWTRFMGTLLRTRRWHRLFYSDSEWKKLYGDAMWPDGESPKVIAHLLPGFAYLILPTGIALWI